MNGRVRDTIHDEDYVSFEFTKILIDFFLMFQDIQ